MKDKHKRILKDIIHTVLTFSIIILMYLVTFLACYKFNFNHLFWKQNYVSETVANSRANHNLYEIAKIDHVKRIPSLKSLDSPFSTLKSRGRTYGWLDALGFLQPKKEYVLHFTYHSQLYPLYAPDACEASSLRMALSTKGIAKHVSMRTFINRIPRSSDPHKGYTSNPYFYGDSASIYPDALAKYARKYYHADVKDISKSSKKEFIRQIKHGNPIVFEGAYQMSHISSDHTLVVIGYRSGQPGQFLVADPFVWKNHGNKVFWTSTTNFMNIYKSKLRGERALVVK